MKDNQREEMSYLAGLFDGEGTICLQKDNRPCFKDTGKGWNPIYNVSLRIGMINKEAIQSFKDFFKVGYIDIEKSYHAFRPMFRYSVRAKDDVLFVIKQLEPFLRVKKENAKLALRYYKECPSRRGLFMTPEILAKKEQFFLQMKQLNGVDISPATTKRKSNLGRGNSVRIEAIV